MASERHGILEDAADWIVRSEESDFSAEEAARLAQWLDTDPRHAAAFRELKTLWQEIPSLPGVAVRWPIAANDDPEPVLRSAWRMWVVGGLAVSATAAAAVFLYFPFGAQPEQRIATDIAQISQVTLDDGSVATLGPKTEISVAFSDGQRRVRLAYGEAFFDVAGDTARPFVVETDRATVRVVGTRFNVKDGSDLLQVAVVEGTVRLLDLNRFATTPLGTLHRGDVARMSGPVGRSRLHVSRSNDIDRLGTLAAGWREGWLTYEDTSLAQIVDDLNRYYRPGVKLADPQIGQTRVTASFKASQLTQFLDTLDGIFPISVEKAKDGGYILRPISADREII